ncbi:GDYXXLXY domain-containing protein [Pseudaestuariivita sp.]|uniref:GDYXXLXY domain-containing protein n=1 Tax=Pseudaestuariivita sp. TaxID=2211669 RepID=UPI004057DD2C
MSRLLVLGCLAAALVQTGLIGAMLLDRAARLEAGREVTLRTTMVDPRDLFRGHYVTLNFQIARLDRRRVATPDMTGTPDDAALYVRLRPGSGGVWEPVDVHFAPPSQGVVLKGEYSFHSENLLGVSFPFRRYYAPYKRAQELEDLRDAGELGVILAVTEDGSAVIKGIAVGGSPVYLEPLF